MSFELFPKRPLALPSATSLQQGKEYLQALSNLLDDSFTVHEGTLEKLHYLYITITRSKDLMRTVFLAFKEKGYIEYSTIPPESGKEERYLILSINRDTIFLEQTIKPEFSAFVDTLRR